jgi:hypothetical protein
MDNDHGKPWIIRLVTLAHSVRQKRACRWHQPDASASGAPAAIKILLRRIWLPQAKTAFQIKIKGIVSSPVAGGISPKTTWALHLFALPLGHDWG